MPCKIGIMSPTFTPRLCIYWGWIHIGSKSPDANVWNWITANRSTLSSAEPTAFLLLGGEFMFDAEFGDTFAQGRTGNAEQLRSLDLISSCLDQGLDDQFALHGWKDAELAVVTGVLEQGAGEGWDAGVNGAGGRRRVGPRS